MAEDVYRVKLTASFLECLNATLAFLTESDAAFAFDDLLAEMRATVIPNLARFPRIGRRYLDNLRPKRRKFGRGTDPARGAAGRRRQRPA